MSKKIERKKKRIGEVLLVEKLCNFSKRRVMPGITGHFSDRLAKPQILQIKQSEQSRCLFGEEQKTERNTSCSLFLLSRCRLGQSLSKGLFVKKMIGVVRTCVEIMV